MSKEDSENLQNNIDSMIEEWSDKWLFYVLIYRSISDKFLQIGNLESTTQNVKRTLVFRELFMLIPN